MYMSGVAIGMGVVIIHHRRNTILWVHHQAITARTVAVVASTVRRTVTCLSATTPTLPTGTATLVSALP